MIKVGYTPDESYTAFSSFKVKLYRFTALSKKMGYIVIALCDR